MIKVKSEAPDKYTFVCDTDEEKVFVDSHQFELFDEFIHRQTEGRIKSLEDLNAKAAELGIRYFWHITRELAWTQSNVSEFERFVNEAYNRWITHISITGEVSLNCS